MNVGSYWTAKTKNLQAEMCAAKLFLAGLLA